LEKKTLFLIIAGIISAVIYTIFAQSIKDQEMIWLLTRIFGLIAFVCLLITILLGEMRLLSFIKADFVLFRFHTPMAISSTYLILLHFISALSDKYMWGINLSFTQFFGFSFSDKWLTFLSLGTLAFYLILIVAFTSAKKSIQFLGFKKWKLVHYLSYISFVIVYIHAMNLGTDIKHSAVSGIIAPFFIIGFFTVNSLVIARFLKGFNIFSDQTEINLAVVFFIFLILGGVFLVSLTSNAEERIATVSNKISIINNAIDQKTSEITNITLEISYLENQIEVIKNG
jgi:DMSO/TMAO reductase YedYZ heme-binding membrane subunit